MPEVVQAAEVQWRNQPLHDFRPQRKQWSDAKKLEDEREPKCSDCGGPVSYMGVDFKPPRRNQVNAWREVESFIASGKVYVRGTAAT